MGGESKGGLGSPTGSGGDSDTQSDSDHRAWHQRPIWTWLALVGAALVFAITIARLSGWVDSLLFYIVVALSGSISLITLTMTKVLPEKSFRVAVTGAIAALLGVVVLLVLLAVSDSAVEVPPMSGDFRIAVAEFGEMTDDGSVVRSDTAASLSESVSLFLVDEAAALADLTDDDVRIRSSAETGPITGADRETRARQARNLADEIQADLVLYGVLGSESGKAVFTPEFVLTGRKLDQAEEFVLGHFELGTPIVSRGTLDDAQKTLRQALEARTIAFARFVIGLTSFRVGDFEVASAYFTDALNAESPSGEPAWRDEDGKELVYLFLGNSLGKAGNLAEAERNYLIALELSDGQFARAWVGLGEVARALSGCGDDSAVGGIDRELLDEAFDAYSNSQTAAFQPAVSEIGAKAAFGKGRIHVCYALLRGLGEGKLDSETQSQVDDARIQFANVLEEYHPSGGEVNPRIQKLAAEAHMFLGLIWILEAPGEAAYGQALSEYEKALKLHEDDERRALIYGWLGWLNGELPGRQSRSEQNCQEAIKLGLDPAYELCPSSTG